MKSERLSYHRLTIDDLENLVSIYRDVEVRRYLGGELVEKDAYSKAESLIEGQPELIWVLRDNLHNFVGIIELGSYHNLKDTEVSYQLNPLCWGKGYATEALISVEEYAFKKLFLTKIVAETQSENQKSIKLLEKRGFKIVKELLRFGKNQLLFEKNA